MSIDVKTSRIVDTTTTISIDKADMVELLKVAGVIDESILVSDTEVYFTVPGGGDWSNMNADITKTNPVNIVYKKRETEES